MSSPQRPSSSSVPRRTFSDRISAVGAKINRALSNEGRARYDADAESITSTIVEGQDRSQSRSRDSGYHSSGRGGAGNIRAVSAAQPANGAEQQEFPWPRGRERAPVHRAPPAQTQPQAPVAPVPAVRSTGRGGAGNFSQSPPPTDPSYSLRDREIMRAHAQAEAEKSVVRSSGRGGMGNITRDAPAAVPVFIPTTNANPAPRSRSRSIDPISTPTSLVPATSYSPSPSRERGGGGGGGYGGGQVNGRY
ncbi:hypothetical protein C8R44DRAFT_876423 [Mycena epipterygia]|nr:hypothetical protein C8R44DRAFT_876423 [Mycena epipterygia]